MSTARVTLPGTIRSDGTLDLESSVALPPGPVWVTIEAIARPEVDRPGQGLVEVLDAIHASQRARGFLGQAPETWEADRDRVEAEEDAERWRTIWSQTVSGPPPETSA